MGGFEAPARLSEAFEPLPARPAVSIVVASHNSAAELPSTLDSLLLQSYDRMEIIVVDDASSDGSAELLGGFSDARLRWHRNQQTVGRYAALNQAIGLASGLLIAVRRIGDRPDRDAITRQVTFLQAQSRAAAVTSLEQPVNASRRNAPALPKPLRGGGLFDLQTLAPALLEHGGRILPCHTAMIRRDALGQVGLFAEQVAGPDAEVELWCRLLERFPIGILDAVLIRSGSASNLDWQSEEYRRVNPATSLEALDGLLERWPSDRPLPAGVRYRYQVRRAADLTFRAVNLYLTHDRRRARDLIDSVEPLAKLERGSAARLALIWLNRALVEAGLRGAPRQLVVRAMLHLNYPERRRDPVAKVTRWFQARQEQQAGPRRTQRAVFIDPFTPHFYRNLLFEPGGRLNRDNALAPHIYLREYLQRRGVEVHTADYLMTNEVVAERNIYCSFGINRHYRTLVNRTDVQLRAFFAFECPVVDPELYRRLPEIARHFERVYSWGTTEGLLPYTGTPVALHRFRWPQARSSVIPELWERRERGMLTLINSNKRARLGFGELYTERLRAITHFGESGVLDLYGVGWEDSVSDARAAAAVARCYRGAPTSKHETLARYRFALCFENAVCPGWITEKLFDCFFAGTVPVYLGAPDIAELVPADCFIDPRRYSGYDELYEALVSIPAAEVEAYRERARAYLESPMFSPFRKETFAELVASALLVDEAPELALSAAQVAQNR